MSDPSLKQSIEFAQANNDSFIAQYKAFLTIPSIGTDPDHQEDVKDASAWLLAEVERIGLEHGQILEPEGQPAVYADWLHAGEDAPTVLLYAHYDVQPVDPLELWDSPPFEPTVREGKLYARGAVDDKSGVFLHLKALESVLVATGSLPINVKVIFEGEEESGSPTMEPLIKAHKDLLDADVVVISDGGSSDEYPMMMASTRGIVVGEVRARGPQRDLHSGSYGGVVQNPTHVVGKIIAAFHDDDGHIQIPGFYDDVTPISDAQQALIEENEARAIENAEEVTGLETFWGEPGFSYLERATARPTCDVNGITGGYQGPGGKTVLPAEASFKVSMRLVKDQDPEDIAEKFKTFVQSFATETVDVEVEVFSWAWPTETVITGPIAQAVIDAYTETWGEAPKMERGGGSVPIIGMFQQILQAPVTTLGLGHGRNIHSPNEYYDLEYFDTNIATAIHFYFNIA
jgi:acetylornithine deacetylase/succinyl-diaminopimelate desuccinylase-like protein